jgi:hypothetical protein
MDESKLYYCMLKDKRNGHTEHLKVICDRVHYCESETHELMVMKTPFKSSTKNDRFMTFSEKEKWKI